MGLIEAIEYLKQNKKLKLKLRGSRWRTFEYVYYSKGKLLTEKQEEFDEESIGIELYRAPEEKYTIR